MLTNTSRTGPPRRSHVTHGGAALTPALAQQLEFFSARMVEEPSITKRARCALRRASKTTRTVIAGFFLLCGEMAMATHETGPAWNANGNKVQMPSPSPPSPSPPPPSAPSPDGIFFPTSTVAIGIAGVALIVSVAFASFIAGIVCFRARQKRPAATEHEQQYPALPSPSSSAPLPPNQVGWRTKSDVDVVTVDHPRHEGVVVGLADLRAVPVDLFVEYSSEE